MAVIGQKLQTMYHQIVVSWESLPKGIREQVNAFDNGVSKRNYVIAKSELKNTFR